MKTMNDRDFSAVEWRTSTHSGQNGANCVSVAMVARSSAIRDSKRAGDSPVILLGAGPYQSFIAVVRDGRSV